MKKFMLTIATVVSASVIFAGCASKNETPKVSETTEQVVDTTDVTEDVAEEPVVTEESVAAEDPVEDVIIDDSTEDSDVAEDDTIDLSFLMGDYEDVDRSSLTETMDFDWCTAYYDPDMSIAVATCVKDGGVKDGDEIYPGVTFKAYCDGLDNVLDHPINREMLRKLISTDSGEKYEDTNGLTIVTILSDYLYFVENPTTVEVYGCFGKEEDSFFITSNDEFTFKLTLVDKTKILINDEESDFPALTEDVRNSYKSKIETALGL